MGSCQRFFSGAPEKESPSSIEDSIKDKIEKEEAFFIPAQNPLDQDRSSVLEQVAARK